MESPNIINHNALKKYIKKCIEKETDSLEKENKKLWGNIIELRDEIKVLKHKLKTR